VTGAAEHDAAAGSSFTSGASGPDPASGAVGQRRGGGQDAADDDEKFHFWQFFFEFINFRLFSFNLLSGCLW
jgi:hypothetical protein